MAFQNADPDGATTSSSLVSGDQTALAEKMDMEEGHHAVSSAMSSVELWSDCPKSAAGTPEDSRESDEAVEDPVSSDREVSQKTSSKRKRNTVDKDRGGRRKKARLETSPAAETSDSATSIKSSKKTHAKRSMKKRTVESDDETDAENDSSLSPGSSKPSANVRPRMSPPPSDPESEITGLLIEALATSRASSLPISSLYKTLMQSRPSLKEQKTKKEWFEIFLKVLSRGNRSGQGVFGKVESSGKVCRLLYSAP